MDGYITIGTELDTKKFDQQIEDVERKVNELEKELSANKELGFLSPEELHQANLELEKAKNKLVGLYKQKMKLQGGKKDTTFSDMGSALAKATKQAGKLALGIFGIRSAYMLLRRASSELASYNEQYATDLEYIRYALTQMIAPVLIYIVNLAGQLLAYINAIVNSLFGINLFGDASAESFMKMKKGASGVSSAVKEIKKQLAGFDEMNVLTDDKASGGGGGGVVAPSFDLSDLERQTMDWLDGIVDWISDHSGEIIALVGLIIAGIGAQIAGGLPLIIAGVLVVIWGLILAFWDDIKSWLQGGIDWLREKSEEVKENCGGFIGMIYDIFVDGLQLILDVVDLIITSIKDQFKNFIEFFQAVFTGDWETAWKKILDIATKPLEFLQGLWTKVFEFITNIFDHFVEFLKSGSGWIRETFGDTIGDIYDKVVKHFELIRDLLQRLLNNMKTIFSNVIDFIKNIFTGQWEKAFENLKNIFIAIFDNIAGIVGTILQMLWNVITMWAVNIGGAIGDAISGAFKNVVNGILGAVEYILNGPIRTINSLIGVINAIPGVSLGRLSTFSLPRLAVGGIVNMPNTGVMVGNAIAGESGREGVLPLTDAQVMAELGREIGRWITINANITNTMNGRVISRELRTIQNEQSFAYNT